MKREPWLAAIPGVLIALRFVLAPLIWLSVWLDSSRVWFLAGYAAAFFSDIFDGVIARRLHNDTPQMRVQTDTWIPGSWHG